MNNQSTITFEKYQALGNDFIIVSPTRLRGRRLTWSRNRVQKICDRHRGIGADGLIVLQPTRQRRVMRFVLFNADGTSAELSGNGLRCSALWAFRRGLFESREIIFETKAGARTVRATGRAMTNPTFELNLGIPRVRFLTGGLCSRALARANRPVVHAGEYAVDVGNPHRILIGKSVPSEYDQICETLQSRFKTTAGMNIEWARIVSRKRLAVTVFERGVGPSSASGTGAAAAFAATRVQGLVDRRVTVSMAGGDLTVSESSDTGAISIIGSSHFICDGHYEKS